MIPSHTYNQTFHVQDHRYRHTSLEVFQQTVYIKVLPSFIIHKIEQENLRSIT